MLLSSLLLKRALYAVQIRTSQKLLIVKQLIYDVINVSEYIPHDRYIMAYMCLWIIVMFCVCAFLLLLYVTGAIVKYDFRDRRVM